MKRWWTISLALLASPGLTFGANDSLVGTWELVSARGVGVDGRPSEPFGRNPGGTIVITRDGWMSAIITHSGRAPLSGDRTTSPVGERAEAFASSLAYSGRYRVEGSRFITRVEYSTIPNWVNTDQAREIRIEGDRLIFRPPPQAVGGVESTEVVWRRAEP